jgi:hypothetical protein
MSLLQNVLARPCSIDLHGTQSRQTLEVIWTAILDQELIALNARGAKALIGSRLSILTVKVAIGIHLPMSSPKEKEKSNLKTNLNLEKKNESEITYSVYSTANVFFLCL